MFALNLSSLSPDYVCCVITAESLGASRCLLHELFISPLTLHCCDEEWSSGSWIMCFPTFKMLKSGWLKSVELPASSLVDCFLSNIKSKLTSTGRFSSLDVICPSNVEYIRVPSWLNVKFVAGDPSSFFFSGTLSVGNSYILLACSIL